MPDPIRLFVVSIPFQSVYTIVVSFGNSKFWVRKDSSGQFGNRNVRAKISKGFSKCQNIPRSFLCYPRSHYQRDEAVGPHCKWLLWNKEQSRMRTLGRLMNILRFVWKFAYAFSLPIRTLTQSVHIWQLDTVSNDSSTFRTLYFPHACIRYPIPHLSLPNASLVSPDHPPSVLIWF